MDGVPLRWLVHEVDTRAGSLRPPLLSVSIHRGVVPRSEITDDVPRAEDLSNYKLCWPGDLVLNRMRAFQGAIGIAPIHGLVSPDYLVLRAETDSEPRYLHHAFRSMWFVGEMTARIRGIGSVDLGAARTPRINAEDLLDIRMPVPSVVQQRRIADFLDDQVARIDNIIAAREEQAQLVNETVSRVLLDAARELGVGGDSALNWFPAWRPGWSIQRLSWLVRCLDGRRIPLNATERASRQGDYPYYGASTVVDHLDDYIFDGEYVLIGEDGAALENPRFDVVQRVSGRIWVNNHAHVLEARGIEPDYLAHYMRCVDRQVLISGATRPKITQEDLLALPVIVPPAEERRVLVADCDRRVAGISSATTLLSDAVSRLTELKRSLITSAVIGEFDVSSANGSRVPV